jgi:hypothetical protein
MRSTALSWLGHTLIMDKMRSGVMLKRVNDLQSKGCLVLICPSVAFKENFSVGPVLANFQSF